MATDATVRARGALHRATSVRGPDFTQIKLPHISEWMPNDPLPTPPASTEMEKRHSFSDRDDDSTRGDYFSHPSYGPIDHANTPLFTPPSMGSPSSRFEQRTPDPSRRGTPVNEPALLNKTMSSIVSDFENAIAQHSSSFRSRHPTFHGPSIEDYHVVAAFTDEVRRRTADDFQHRQSPQSSPRESYRDSSLSRNSGRAIAPRPLYNLSPISTPSGMPGSPGKRSQCSLDSPPLARLTLDSPTGWDDDEMCRPPNKKRRSTNGSSRRRHSGCSSPKETKHNRNRSTKEKKSTDYRDYPGDISPHFETMADPMGAAAQCPEHTVANPRNLGSDPLRNELHESERIVAQKLNIDCAYFLCVKRQIFQRYLEHLTTRSFNWNKTAAQQCSNVDVGKTSQIFMFFQRVGWFNEELYKGKF